MIDPNEVLEHAVLLGTYFAGSNVGSYLFSKYAVPHLLSKTNPSISKKELSYQSIYSTRTIDKAFAGNILSLVMPARLGLNIALKQFENNYETIFQKEFEKLSEGETK